MGFSFGELRTEYRWQEQAFKGLSLGYYGGFWDLDTGEFLGDGTLSDLGDMAEVLLDAVREIRHRELRLECIDRGTGAFLARTLNILDRSARGEYLGQDKGRQSLTPRVLASILDWSVPRTLDLLEKAAGEGKLSIGSGQVWALDSLVSLEQERRDFGHERFELREWGRWACRACDSWSRSYSDDPRSFYCDANLRIPY